MLHTCFSVSLTKCDPLSLMIVFESLHGVASCVLRSVCSPFRLDAFCTGVAVVVDFLSHVDPPKKRLNRAFDCTTGLILILLFLPWLSASPACFLGLYAKTAPKSLMSIFHLAIFLAVQPIPFQELGIVFPHL
ncbi:hypothetical protein Pelo_5178 [Pelomyxa schiedti]|nr:hypothetical protein Pelo_5178 [Pelomyxa schiedti]